MKRSICSILYFIFITSFSWAQTINNPIHNKYWYYRWRLTHQFLKEGLSNYVCDNTGQLSGHSIPAGNRMPPSKAAEGKGWLHWGDGTANLGWYIGILATEYKLLSNAGQPTNAVKEELYYAMKAYERLDKFSGRLYSPYNSDLCSVGVDGFFVRDDVNRAFIESFRDAGTPHTMDDNSGSDYITKAQLQIFHDANTQFREGYMSQDQVAHLFIGFSLVAKLISSDEFFTHPTNPTEVFRFKERAAFFSNKIGRYIQSNGWATPIPGTLRSTTFSDEIKPSAFGIWKAANAISAMAGQSLLPPDDVVSNPLAVQAWMQHETGQYMEFPGFNWWRFKIPDSPDYVKCLIMAYAAVGDSWENTSLGLHRLGQQHNIEIFSLLHKVLHPQRSMPLPSGLLTDIQNMLWSAPCKGTYNFPEDPDPGVAGWRASNRFEKSDHSLTGDPNFQAEFNGQDFMLLHNLYALAYSEDVSVSPYTEGLNPVLRNYTFPGYTYINTVAIPTPATDYLGFETLTLAENTIVETGATVDFKSPSIIIRPGFVVQAGAKVRFATPLVDNMLACVGTTGRYARQSFEAKAPTTTVAGSETAESTLVYPNPFTNSVTVKFYVKEAQTVSLVIANAFGQRVAKPVDERLYRAGTHQIRVNTSGFKPGVYFYSLQKGQTNETKKLIKL